MKQGDFWTEEAESKPIMTIIQSHSKSGGCANSIIMNGTNSTRQKESQGNPLQAWMKPSLPAGSRNCANPTLSPGSSWAKRMTELSGRSLSRSLDGSSPIISCLKTLLESSIWRSTACYLTWRRKATKQGRSYFQLAPSTPRTGEIGSGLWHTPRASEAEHPGRKSTAHGGQIGLAEQVNNSVLFPTPTANRWDGLQSHGVNVVEGSLNAAWVEILMGYPEGWTDLYAADQTTGVENGSAGYRESPKACPTEPTD